MNIFSLKLGQKKLFHVFSELEHDNEYILESITADMRLWGDIWMLGDTIKVVYGGLENESSGGYLIKENMNDYKIILSKKF